MTLSLKEMLTSHQLQFTVEAIATHFLVSLQLHIKLQLPVSVNFIAPNT